MRGLSRWALCQHGCNAVLSTCATEIPKRLNPRGPNLKRASEAGTVRNSAVCRGVSSMLRSAVKRSCLCGTVSDQRRPALLLQRSSAPGRIPATGRAGRSSGVTMALFGTNSKPREGTKVKYLYDGDCKVCQTFKTTLDVQDAGKGNIQFVNIAEKSFSPRQHNNVQYDDAMSTIHAITKEGKTVKGPDAVRALFGAAGPALGWAASASKLPGFAALFGLLYKFLAKYRYPISNTVTSAQKKVKS